MLLAQFADIANSIPLRSSIFTSMKEDAIQDSILPKNQQHTTARLKVAINPLMHWFTYDGIKENTSRNFALKKKNPKKLTKEVNK